MAMLTALAVLAAACSDPSAFAPADPDNEGPLGPTVLTDDGDSSDDDTPSVTIAPFPTLPPTVPLPPPSSTMPPPDPVTVLATGNLGNCDAASTHVAKAIAADSGLIFAVGDLSIDGSQASIHQCLLPALESDLDRVYAVPGNQDLATDEGAAFYDLLGRTPTGSTPGQGWFVTSLGGWQIIGLNSRCDDIGGCDADSEQYRWLDAVLRDQPAACRVAFWHDARFSSALDQRDATAMGLIVGRLDGAGADVVITGSPGNYERLGPLRPSGAVAADDEQRIQHFNIGGGSSVGFEDPPLDGSQAREGSVSGYVRFVFEPDGYTWEFVPTSEGPGVPDLGSGTC